MKCVLDFSTTMLSNLFVESSVFLFVFFYGLLFFALFTQKTIFRFDVTADDVLFRRVISTVFIPMPPSHSFRKPPALPVRIEKVLPLQRGLCVFLV